MNFNTKDKKNKTDSGDTSEVIDLPLDKEFSSNEIDVDDKDLTEVGFVPKEEVLGAEPIVSLPISFALGFYEDIKKSDLKEYLKSKSDKLNGDGNIYYFIKKYNTGYIWEIHEGGSGRGVTSSIIKKLEHSNDVVFKISGKKISVEKNPVTGSINSYILNENDESEPTDGVEFKDKMNEIESRGVATLIFGVVFCFLGLISLIGMVGNKYIVFDKQEPLEFIKPESSLPFTQFSDLEKISKSKTEYLRKIQYTKSGGWEIDVQKDSLAIVQQKKYDNTKKELEAKELSEIETNSEKLKSEMIEKMNMGGAR